MRSEESRESKREEKSSPNKIRTQIQRIANSMLTDYHCRFQLNFVIWKLKNTPCCRCRRVPSSASSSSSSGRWLSAPAPQSTTSCLTTMTTTKPRSTTTSWRSTRDWTNASTSCRPGSGRSSETWTLGSPPPRRCRRRQGRWRPTRSIIKIQAKI